MILIIIYCFITFSILAKIHFSGCKVTNNILISNTFVILKLRAAPFLHFLHEFNSAQTLKKSIPDDSRFVFPASDRKFLSIPLVVVRRECTCVSSHPYPYTYYNIR